MKIKSGPQKANVTFLTVKNFFRKCEIIELALTEYLKK